MEGIPAGTTSSIGESFPGRLGVQQRVLPDYRASFFNLLAQCCQRGLSVFAGVPVPGEAIQSAAALQTAAWQRARNLNIGSISTPTYLCWQHGLVSWLKSWQPDVLILEANPRYISSPLALHWMHARGRPVIGWGLGPGSGSGIFARLALLRRHDFLHNFDALIAYSQRGAQAYMQTGFPSERVFVASNAAASRPVMPPPERPGYFTGKPRLLFVGRLQARKRIDLLLRACSALPAEIQPHVTIVGDGPAKDELRLLAKEVYPEAEFPGARRGADLEPYFSAADLFALPGTGGLAVQHAMAYGLPVIVAEGDGSQDDLVRPQNGWQIIPDSLDALTDSLKAAFSDVSRLRRMGYESYRVVSEEVNLEQMVSVFIKAAKFLMQYGCRENK